MVRVSIIKSLTRGRDGRLKSASEANLLGSEVYYEQEARGPRRSAGIGYFVKRIPFNSIVWIDLSVHPKI